MTGAPQVRVGAVCVRGDELLLVRSGHGPAAGTWDVPGDAVRAGELLAEAVVRVVGDQAGLEGLCGPFIGWAETLDEQVHAVTMYFDAIVLGERDDPADADAPDPSEHGPDATPTAAERRSVPTWDVCELRLVHGLAEFLADQGIIETVV